MFEKQIPYTFINEEDVMKRLGGNIALFNRLFEKFITLYCFADADIQKLLDAKEYENARLLAHTIKGTSANLGVTDLWSTAAELEKNIVVQDDIAINEAMKEFSDALTEIMKEVGKR